MTDTTYEISVVTQAVIDVLQAADSLNLTDVWYGDQITVPRTPSAAVEPGVLRRDIHGASTPFRTQNLFDIQVFVYLAQLQPMQTIDAATDLLLDQVAKVLNADTKLGGLLIYGFTRIIDPGYALRGKSLFRTGKITYTGMTVTFPT